MINRTKTKKMFPHLLIIQFLALAACFSLFGTTTLAQTTPGGTQIQNQASATYSDGTTTYTTVSNTVTVTVSNVSGITITPDGGTRPTVVSGQQNVLYSFRVTNTGNFQDQVRFLANGNSIQLTGPATIAAAVIDADNNGSIGGGDTNILTNSADVISANIAANGFIDVLVAVNINANAVAGNVINVQLGDATTGAPSYDNQPSNNSTREVRTVSTASANGLREARGDVSATVSQDAQLQLNLNAPAGPVALGANIGYTWEVCNTGSLPAQSITLVNAPAGSNTGVFIIAPIPVGTSLASGQTFPAGTLYTTSPLSTSPLTATYTTTAPADLSTVRRVAFRVGATLANGACSPQISMAVTVTTTNASTNIYEIGDAFANNSIGSQITDQSGDAIGGAGYGNANFDEGDQPGNVDGNGIQLITTLQRLGSVYIGPLNKPQATGPTSQNDDYTNRSVTTGIAGIPFGGNTSAAGTIVFQNTILNSGNSNDTFAITVRSLPAGFTVEISVDNEVTYTTMTTLNSVNLPINFNSSKTIHVRVIAPAGSAVLQDGGFPVVIRSTSTATPSAYNETIDRLYTGVLRMDKTATVINNTGVGGATDAVPGADIEYTIAYRNISTTGGSDNGELSLSNVVITENGNAAPNNWGTTTTQVVGSASDTRGGAITGDTAGSSILTDTLTTLPAGQSGTFKFRRRIR